MRGNFFPQHYASCQCHNNYPENRYIIFLQVKEERIKANNMTTLVVLWGLYIGLLKCFCAEQIRLLCQLVIWALIFPLSSSSDLGWHYKIHCTLISKSHIFGLNF